MGKVETFHGPWYYPAPKESLGNETQIDLLINRKDAAINLCEMKFSEAEFTIDSEYSKNLRKKVDAFKTITQTKKSI